VSGYCSDGMGRVVGLGDDDDDDDVDIESGF